MLEEQLKALAEYEVDFKYQKDWFIVGITFKPQWVIVEPSNTLIEYVEKDGRYYYGAPVDSIKVDDIFCCINETIEYNKDIERKMDLFNRKVDELQELFAIENYDDLITLEFKLKRKKTAKATKTNKSIKHEVNIKEQKEENKQEKVKVEQYIPVDTPIINNTEVDIPDDGVVYVDTIAEAYKEEEQKKNKNKI